MLYYTIYLHFILNYIKHITFNRMVFHYVFVSAYYMHMPDMSLTHMSMVTHEISLLRRHCAQVVSAGCRWK